MMMERSDLVSLTKEGVVRLDPIHEQIGTTHVRIPYKARSIFKPYHARKQRFAWTVAHRRAGKTVTEVNDCIRKMIKVKRAFPPPQVAYISPTFAQGKRNAWMYAKYYTSVIPGIKVREGDLTLEFPDGGKYIFIGSDNFDSIRGLYLDHASMDEFGTQDPRVWGEVVRPALSDYRGTATFIGSAHGRNHFYDLKEKHIDDPEWMFSTFKASQTGILPQEELEDAKKTMTDEQYRQEYECDFDAAVTGTFYGKELELAYNENRIRPLMYERALDVYAGWDLGLGGAMSVWLYQRVGVEWRFLAYYEGFKPDDGLEEAVNWLKMQPFKAVTHFLPHDANVKETMLTKLKTSRKEFLEQRGLNCTVLERRPVADGINTVRVNFNKFLFDSVRCKQGLDCLKMYRSEYNEEKKVFSDKPVHDWASHAADALRSAVMGMPDMDNRSDWKKPINRHVASIA